MVLLMPSWMGCFKICMDGEVTGIEKYADDG
jgi:hypothetical protein